MRFTRRRLSDSLSKSQRASVAVALCLLLGCGGSGDEASLDRGQEWIEVAPGADGFELVSSNEPFVPWGFNYDHDEEVRLLEDYWVTEWPKVEDDFEEMDALGANVVRVHLQFARFMTDATTPNERTLEQLERLVALAEELGLYLDLTGLAAYRAEDVPEWYASLSDENSRWDVQARFWEAVASRVFASPAIFSYDLMNEPIVPVGQLEPGKWMGPEFAGLHFTQYISFDQAGRDRADIARAWIERMTEAIRTHDDRHLITVGLLPPNPDLGGHVSGFEPEEVGDIVDFVSVHLYPRADRVPEALETLEEFDVGKPILVEETYNLRCSADELETFITGSKRTAAGWLGFYWGQTPDQLEGTDDVGAAIQREWLTLFEKLRPALAG